MWKAFSCNNSDNQMIFMSVEFDTETIRLITLFENITGAPVKDCLYDMDSKIVHFVIDEGKVGIAIGKNGNSVKNAEKLIGKTIKLYEFSENMKTFIKNLIPQTSEIKIKNENERTVVEIRVDKKSKAVVIGRDGKNLKIFRELLQRNHQVSDIVVR